MKSPMINNADFIQNKDGYSALKVMKSAAGWYVGTTYTENGITEPGSRDSDYFGSREEAEHYLELVSNVINPQEYLRDMP